MTVIRHVLTVMAMCLGATAAPLAHSGHCNHAGTHHIIPWQRGAFLYDTSTETTVMGTIEMLHDVTPPAHVGCRSLGGTHLTLNTGDGTLQVHLGPTPYLQSQKLTLSKGESIQVLGSRVVIDGEAVILARQVKKGDTIWTLRDAAGRPMWSSRNLT
jgi:hypothetical protein